MVPRLPCPSSTPRSVLAEGTPGLPWGLFDRAVPSTEGQPLPPTPPSWAPPENPEPAGPATGSSPPHVAQPQREGGLALLAEAGGNTHPVPLWAGVGVHGDSSGGVAVGGHIARGQSSLFQSKHIPGVHHALSKYSERLSGLLCCETSRPGLAGPPLCQSHPVGGPAPTGPPGPLAPSGVSTLCFRPVGRQMDGPAPAVALSSPGTPRPQLAAVRGCSGCLGEALHPAGRDRALHDWPCCERHCDKSVPEGRLGAHAGWLPPSLWGPVPRASVPGPAHGVSAGLALATACLLVTHVQPAGPALPSPLCCPRAQVWEAFGPTRVRS